MGSNGEIVETEVRAPEHLLRKKKLSPVFMTFVCLQHHRTDSTLNVMKTNNIFYLLFLIILVSCASQKSVSDADRDGLTIDRAVKAKSVDFEYVWVEKRYPGSRVTGQVLLTRKRIPYDKLEVVTSDGRKIDVYFDISSFFGKW
jgi:hypothetical protein